MALRNKFHTILEPLKLNLMLGEPCDGLASHPGQSRNMGIPCCFMQLKPELNDGLMGHLACMQTFIENKSINKTR